MKEVQPIRSLEKIQDMKNRLALNGKRDELLFSMGINTGLRISDLLTLKVVDVKGRKDYTLIEKKTKKSKRIMLHAVYDDITEYTKFKADDEYLFASGKRGYAPITRVQAYRILNSAARDIGLDGIGTHTLRKTFGYHFYKKNQNIAMLQQLFNHSSPSITLRYIGITQDEIAEEWENFSL